jgi:hypothetical protein
MYVVPYSDHSPYEELFTFISHLKPTKIYPIVNETKLHIKKQWHCGFVNTRSTLTDSLYQLCREKSGESTDCRYKELTMPCDTEEYKVLPAQLACDIRHAKSLRKPRIIQRKKLSQVFQKKGVQFESSFTSDEGGDETLHTTELERKEITVRTSCGKFTRVKIPYNLKDNWSDVQVKLFDIRDFVHEYPRQRPENRGDASSYTMPSHSVGDRISGCTHTGTASEEFGICSSAYDSDGYLLQDTSLSCALHIKHTSTQGNPSDIDQISLNSLSDVTKAQTKLLVDTVKSEQECEDRVWPFSISMKEDSIENYDIKQHSDNGNLSRDGTEDTLKNPMVMIPTDSDVAQKLLESSELNNVTEEAQINRRWMCTRSSPKRKLNKPTRYHSCSRNVGIIVSNDADLMDTNRMCKRKKCCTKQKCVSRNIHRLPCSRFSCHINAIGTCKAHDIQYDATQNKSCRSNLHKTSDDRIQITSVKSLKTSDWSSEANIQQSDNGSLLHFSPAPTLLTSSDAQSHNVSDNRIQVTSVKSLRTSDWSSEANMQQSDTGSLSQFSPAPTLLTSSGAQYHDTSVNSNQVTSVISLQTSDWSSEANLQQSDTGSLLQFSPAPTLLTSSDTQSHNTSDNRIQVTSVKSLQTSDWSSEANVQQSDTGSLSQFSPAPTLLTSSGAQSHETSDNRIQVTSVKSLQTSDWSSEANMQQSDTGSLLQFSPASTQLTSLEAQSHSKRNFAVRGCRTNIKRKNIALVQEEKRVTSRLKTRDKITFTKKTRSWSHSFKKPETNSSVSEHEQSLNDRSLSSDTCNMLQTDRQHKVGVLCEEMLLSQNTERITTSLQQVEVVTRESGGGIRRSQSDESEEVNVTKRKQSLSEHNFESEKLSNTTLIGSKRDCESSSSETIPIRDSTNEGASHSPRKSHNHNRKSDGQKNTATLRCDNMLQSNSINNTSVHSMNKNVATVTAYKSSEQGKHNKGVRNTPHKSNESHRTRTDQCEASVCPGTSMSAYQMDCNYWTNGNRVPFAIHEVHQAVKQLSLQRSDLPLM